MTELNTEVKKEIRIKQDRLKALLDIESLVDVVSDDKVSDVKKKSILDYSGNEKNRLVIDIVNMCNIDDLDKYYSEDNSKFSTRVTIEDSISFDLNRFNDDSTSFKVINMIINDFMYTLANYDIGDLMNYEVLVYYLKLIDSVTDNYDMINDVESTMKKNT